MSEFAIPMVFIPYSAANEQEAYRQANQFAQEHNEVIAFIGNAVEFDAEEGDAEFACVVQVNITPFSIEDYEAAYGSSEPGMPGNDDDRYDAP